MSKYKIYTNYDGYITRKGVKTINYKELPPPIVDFVDENGGRMYQNPTLSERKIHEMHLFEDITEQVFFSINGRMYFLDFFIPSKHVAIEVDGGYHKLKAAKEHDRQRDIDFFSIGIMTVRVKNSDIDKKGFRDKLLRRCNQPWVNYKRKMKQII